MKKMIKVAMVLGAVGMLVTPAEAQRNRNGFNMQREFGGDYYTPPDWRGNPIYDGRVTFVRIRYRGYENWAPEGPGWAHDYPISESHFAKIMREITTARPFVQSGQIFGSTILQFDDPNLFKYPIAYLSEPGGWHMTAAELAGFKKYIERGGFMIFDDMRGFQIQNLDYEWHRAFPNAKMLPVPPEHPVFNSFFKIDLSKVEAYYGRGARAQFFGYFEDNDPKKRLIAVINNDNDLGEYMEYSEQGFDVVPTNEAYKLAVNYFVYALTH